MEPSIKSDLSIGKHPLIIGKKWPVHIHHWTHDKFEQFMREHRVPVNTWKDQQEARRQSIIQALLKGLPVPAEVLAEDSELEADAEMHRKADAAAVFYQEECKRLKEAFERDIGYTSETVEQYEDSLRKLLLSMLAVDETKRVVLGKHMMLATYNKDPLLLKIVQGRRPTTGAFGTYGGVESKVHIKYGISELAPVLHSFAWSLAERLLTELLVEKKLTYDQIWFWTGVGWGPQISVVHQIRSDKKSAGGEHAAV